MNNQRGFTLIELLVVLAILGLLATAGFMSLSRGRLKSDQDQAKALVVSTLEEARSRAASGFGSSANDHGVHFESARIIAFQTANPSGTYPGSGDNVTLPTSISVNCSPSCPADVIFTRLAGKPRATTDTIITLNPGNIIITVKADGTISTN